MSCSSCPVVTWYPNDRPLVFPQSTFRFSTIFSCQGSLSFTELLCFPLVSFSFFPNKSIPFLLSLAQVCWWKILVKKIFFGLYFQDSVPFFFFLVFEVFHFDFGFEQFPSVGLALFVFSFWAIISLYIVPASFYFLSFWDTSSMYVRLCHWVPHVSHIRFCVLYISFSMSCNLSLLVA